MQEIVAKLKELSIPYPIIEIGGVKYYDLTDFIITKKENDMEAEKVSELEEALQKKFEDLLEIKGGSYDLGTCQGIGTKLNIFRFGVPLIKGQDKEDKITEVLKSYWISKLEGLIKRFEAI